MKKLLLLLLLVAANTIIKAQINETFEAGTTPLNWVAADKAKYLGIVNNPDTNKVSINKSAKCAGFVKDSTTAYSYAFAKLDKPLNLTGKSKFKIQLFSKANRSTKFIIKFEGGKSREVLKITGGSQNRWEELTFDFKADDTVTVFSQITIFFDATNSTSKDTFYFDNLVQIPNDACSGVTPPTTQTLFDDFECQRNAPYNNYSNALDSLTVIDNPDKSGINTSAKVGRYADKAATATDDNAYAGIIIENIDPIDFSKYSVLKIKVWAPVAGNLLLKSEGGVTAKEVLNNITADQTKKWIEYTADFTSVKNAGNTRFVLFFNAGGKANVGDIYYIDDIRLVAQPPIEDFEPVARLTWTPLNNDAALHGSFAVVANPAPTSAVNNSANVGKYTKGTATISVLTSALSGFTLSADAPQLNIQVYVPDSGKTVRVQFVSAATGTIEATATTTTKNAWENLAFDFSKAVGVTDISKINILFDPSTAASGKVFYFDNLIASKSTLNACLAVVPNLNIVDDYECQRNYVTNTKEIKAIANPKITTANQSDKVGQYIDPVDQYSALVYEFPNGIDFSRFNQLNIKIWSPAVVPLAFKVEGGTSPAVEKPTTVTKAGDWVTYITDFSALKGQNHKKLSIFFNFGITPTSATDTYYIDDIQWKSEPITNCVTNFETPVAFQYFANGDLDGKPMVTVPNPKKSGIDTSATVLKFDRRPGSAIYAGAFTDLDAPLKWTNAKYTVRAKVLMDHIGNFAPKLEPGAGSGDAHEPVAPVANKKVNDWEEITTDFSSLVTGAEKYQRLTIFVDLNLPASTVSQVTYIDDIAIGDGVGCAATKVGTNDVAITQLGFAPNPAQNEIYVRNLQNVRRLDVTNVWGQIVKTVSLTNIGSFDIQTIPLEGLSAGMYIVSGYDDKGMIANGKFIKE